MRPALPARCPACADIDWVYSPRGGLTRCDCERGKALGARDAGRGRALVDSTPGVTQQEALLAVAKLGVLLTNVPWRDLERAVIAEAFQGFCCNAGEMFAFVQQASLVFREWPGIRELRALYCSLYSPRDGVEAHSTIYEDGFPSITPVIEQPQIAGGRNGIISASPQAAELVRKMADNLNMDPPVVEVKVELSPPPKPVPPEPKIPLAELEALLEAAKQEQLRIQHEQIRKEIEAGASP